MKKIIGFVLRKVPRKYLQVVTPPLMKLAGWYYRGDQYTCPIADKSYRKFLPYGRVNPRPNALCPDSLSLERHRLLWLYLKRKTNFFSEVLKVLHIAPEPCFMKKFEAQHRDGYITTDLESPLAKVKADIHDLPFDNDLFDASLCNHVMEHVANDILAMKEIYRVLKPGGWAIIMVPFFHPIPDQTLEDPSIASKKDRELHYGQDDHVRKYGRDFPDRLRLAGFHVNEDQFVKTLTAEEIHRFALPEEEIIYFCQKPKQES